MDDLRLQVERWLIKAGRDLATARATLALESPITDIACYHAQQCVEKCFKAVLCSQQRDVPRTHDLARLLEICLEAAPELAAFMQTARDLADYAVETRYPDSWREIPLAEASTAKAEAEALYRAVCAKLEYPP